MAPSVSAVRSRTLAPDGEQARRPRLLRLDKVSPPRCQHDTHGSPGGRTRDHWVLTAIRATTHVEGNLSDYEEDHLIPLELGGAPRDPQNLWPEPRYEAGGYTASDKDTVENRLEREVCADDLTLADACWWIVNDWRDAP